MSPSGNPRLTADERREAIVAAAMPLFADKGFAAVTTREIADAAGVSEALLYRHFPSKQDLFGAIENCCIVQATQDASRLDALPDSTSTLVLAAYLIMRGIQRGNRVADDNQEIARMILRSLASDGDFARRFVQATAARWVDKLSRCVRASIAAGDLQGEFEEAFVGLWFSHHVAAAVKYYALPDEPVVDYQVARDKLLDLSVRFALRGIGLSPQAIARHYNPEAFELMFRGR